MRHEKTNAALKWWGLRIPTGILAGLMLFAALAAVYPELANWGQTVGWPIVSSVYFIASVALIVGAYVFTLVYTGLQQKQSARAHGEGSAAEPSDAGEVEEVQTQPQDPKPIYGADFPALGKAIMDQYDGEVETFAFRKAVLRVSEVKATAMATHTGERTRLHCHLDVENATRQHFRKCRVRLAAINDEEVRPASYLRVVGRKGSEEAGVFNVVPSGGKKRITFLSRDLEDVISKPPFLMHLTDRDLPLSDGKSYAFVFALECEYEHPTYVHVSFRVPSRETVEVRLVDQGLEPPPLKAQR